MITVFALLVLFSENVISKDLIDISRASHPCEVGDAVQNGRVTCQCKDNVYECQLKKYTDLVTSRDGSKNDTQACEPNKVYVQETTTCICNNDGTWPHPACGEIFDHLPPNKVIKTKCQPDGYVIVDCNVCRCTNSGTIDKDRCTKNECDGETSKRRSSKSKNVYGNCEAKNWYSLAPCQFCFCINENKLVCNTGNYFKKSLSLGTYNLSVCGKDLIREAIELIPDGDDKTLRDGEPVDVKPKKAHKRHKTTRTTPTTTTTTRTATPVTAQIDVLVQFNKNNPQTFDLKSNDANEQNLKAQELKEEYSESDEDQGALNPKVEVTQIPYQEKDDYQLYSKESGESVEKGRNSVDNEDSGEVKNGLRIPVAPPAYNTFPTVDTQEEAIQKPSGHPKRGEFSPFENIGRQLLTEKLPMVLTKVFNLALNRKSMVTIDNQSDCVPGDVQMVKCNSCFCLKNNKLLCTNNKCEKEITV